ncbi:hypothetical protein [Actinophytocola sp.]|uniref:hypothetical protein n=1 Tax=Actinophytocola sp. TaxID=1872138 RepID=UPI0025BDD12A|nr:hypothetical protein [Actinophytocola sp.]
MSEHRPDQHTVLGAIALANRAPSVHNTQPWRWLLGNDSIHLVADQTRRLPVTDPDGRDLLLSCGAALHHLRVALGALGWRAIVHRLLNPGDPDHLAAVELVSKIPSTEDIKLVGAISRRRTDRRRFTSWPVPDGHLDLMVRRAAKAGALLFPVTDRFTRRRLTRAIGQGGTPSAGRPVLCGGVGHLERPQPCHAGRCARCQHSGGTADPRGHHYARVPGWHSPRSGDRPR